MRPIRKTQPRPSDAARELRALFDARGHARVPDAHARMVHGQRYRKGYEVRLPAPSAAALERTRALVCHVGLKAGAPFRKGRGFVLPVYGAEAVAWFGGSTARPARRAGKRHRQAHR